eukprot:7516453-Heterocapsa_arctica.AAC.1
MVPDLVPRACVVDGGLMIVPARATDEYGFEESRVCLLAFVGGFRVGQGAVATIEDEPQGLAGSLGFGPHEDDGWDRCVVLAVD